jgi:predicted Mrr-cat superfamily restriction endonuclease
MKFWRIIPGEREYRSTILGKFIRENYVAIGWNPVRDLTNVSENELETVCRDDLSGWREEDIISGIKTFRWFRYGMEVGDIVVVSGDGFVYAVGKITGSYYKEEEPVAMPEDVWQLGFYSYYHRRKVNWIKITKFPFTELPNNTAKKLGTPPTLIELSLNDWLILSSVLLSAR